jgi:hypothetical protein
LFLYAKNAMLTHFASENTGQKIFLPDNIYWLQSFYLRCILIW